MNGEKRGAVRFKWKSDGSFENRREVTQTGQERTGVTQVIPDSDGRWLKISVSGPDGTSEIVREGAAVRIPRVGMVALKPETLIFGPLAPALMSQVLRRYDRARGGTQLFSVFRLGGADVVDAYVEMKSKGNYTVSGRELEMTQFLFALPGAAISVLADSEGRVFRAENLAGHTLFVRQGYEVLRGETSPSRSAESAKPESAAAAPPTRDSGKVKLEPCKASAQKVDALCGKYEVFEDRRAKSGRKIALNLVVLPALTDRPAHDPVFFFAGGPGQSSVNTWTAFVRGLIAKIRTERDVVLVDQRGTGESNPLEIPAIGDRNEIQSYFDTAPNLGALRKSKADLEKIANLTLYTAPIAMDDLDDVREALGYDKINLFGGSYGTTASLVYLRQHPEHVRALVLTGVAPPNYKIPLPFAKAIQHALDRLFQYCAADRDCHTAFPKVREELALVVAKLEKGPVSFEAYNLVVKKMQPVTMTRNAFVSHLRTLLYSPDTARLLPVLIHQAAEGEYGPFASAVYAVGRQLSDGIARGMHFSVACSEGVPFITSSDLTRETADTLAGDFVVKAYQKVCEEWPRAAVPVSFLEPVRSNAPVLILSGELDPVTPPGIAEEAARSLPNSRHIRVHYAAHSTGSDCIDGLSAAFLSKGSAEGLDASCIDTLLRPPFVIPPAAVPAPEGVPEIWEGVLDTGVTKLRIVVRLFNSLGSYAGRLDSLDQEGARDLPMEKIAFSESSLHFELSLIEAVYDGTLNKERAEVAGQWKQSNRSWPLTFKKKS